MHEELCDPATAIGSGVTAGDDADEEADAECHWQPEMDVIYDVDESPPVSLCLLLGFQVSLLRQVVSQLYQCTS